MKRLRYYQWLLKMDQCVREWLAVNMPSSDDGHNYIFDSPYQGVWHIELEILRLDALLEMCHTPVWRYMRDLRR